MSATPSCHYSAPALVTYFWPSLPTTSRDYPSPTAITHPQPSPAVFFIFIDTFRAVFPNTCRLCPPSPPHFHLLFSDAPYSPLHNPGCPAISPAICLNSRWWSQLSPQSPWCFALDRAAASGPVLWRPVLWCPVSSSWHHPYRLCGAPGRFRTLLKLVYFRIRLLWVSEPGLAWLPLVFKMNSIDPYQGLFQHIYAFLLLKSHNISFYFLVISIMIKQPPGSYLRLKDKFFHSFILSLFHSLIV